MKDLKDLKDLKRHAIIYFPDGRHDQWTTSKDMHEGDTHNIGFAEKIVCDPGQVKVTYKEDGDAVGKAYSGFPYVLEMW